MYLLIDAGNSRIKWNIYDAGEARFVMPPQGFFWRGTALPEQLQQHWGSLTDIDQVLLANVAGATLEEALHHYLQTQLGLQLRRITSEAQAFGVKNGYQNPLQLGVDRWLGVLAARQLAPEQPICVVGCGTAITVDTVNKQGEHLGGLIAPGCHLMKTVLIERTHDVKITDSDAALIMFGTNTAAAVNNGALYAAVGFIERVVADIETQLGDTVIKVITGGDAPMITTHLQQPYLQEPQLVLIGLALYVGETK